MIKNREILKNEIEEQQMIKQNIQDILNKYSNCYTSETVNEVLEYLENNVSNNYYRAINSLYPDMTGGTLFISWIEIVTSYDGCHDSISFDAMSFDYSIGCYVVI